MPVVVPWERVTGVLLVLAIHGLVLYGLWSYRLLPAQDEATTLFVSLINPPPPAQKKLEQPPPPPKPLKRNKPQPVEAARPERLLVAEAPVTSVNEAVAMPMQPPPETKAGEAPVALPGPEPVVSAPPAPPAPVMLTSDLAVSCPQRSPPEYPPVSRRMSEQGHVLLKVELDETGRVISARVKESSGFKRLDEAGVAAVKQWHCNVPASDGGPIRVVALQPFDFVIEGRR